MIQLWEFELLGLRNPTMHSDAQSVTALKERPVQKIPLCEILNDMPWRSYSRGRLSIACRFAILSN